MAKVKATDSKRPTRPALPPEAKENEMISLAVDLADKQLREGTASSQIVNHYLKLATTNAKLEREILEKQKELLEAKKQSLQSQSKSDELYERAITAFKKYSGNGGVVDE